MSNEPRVARPSEILIPLIKETLDEMEKAREPHFRTAGELLLEAFPQVGYGKWAKWLSKAGITTAEADKCMKLALTNKKARQVGRTATIPDVMNPQHQGNEGMK